MPPAPKTKSVASYASGNVFDGTRTLTDTHVNRLRTVAMGHATSASPKKRTKSRAKKRGAA